jgi:hypothetical protein
MSYDYKKVFFQRPILTQMNLFFWWFLLITVLWVVPLAIVLKGYFTNLPEDLLTREYKRYTITRLLQIPRSAVIADNVEISKPYFGGMPAEESEIDEEPGSKDAGNEGESPPVVESAPKKNPLKKYQKSKKVYEDNIEKFAVKEDDKVKITPPNFTDFGVVQGYRSFEETITVGTESKKYIENCLDRYFRIYPRFRGKIIVKFNVHPDGHIIPETLRIVQSDIEYKPIQECVKKNIQRWVTYPAVPNEQGIYSVTQKYIF